MQTRPPEPNEINQLLAKGENHFQDFKGREISPAKAQKTFIAFANADGGELYIGIADSKEKGERLQGFPNVEAANNIITHLLEETKPAVENVNIEFIELGEKGFILHLQIPKSPKVHYTSSDTCYIRINASSRRITGERVTQLAYSKGAMAYELQAIERADITDILESETLHLYMTRIRSSQEPERFLKKQGLLSAANNEDYPNVGCVVLFDADPQATLPTRCAFKIYRLLTTESEYKREQLAEMPATVEGPLEDAIKGSLRKIKELLSGASYRQQGRIVKLEYPVEAIKEVLVNAAIHRDYSLNDDIHVKIFDNRIEIQSPGKLPGYMTLENLYSDRFSRNPNIVRLLHKLPDPLNHDIGEGLDTARNELKKAGLIPPKFEEKENSFVVTIKHQQLASVEDVILDYLRAQPESTITNRQVRELSGEDDINKVKKALQRLRKVGDITPVDPKARPFDFSYRLTKKK